MGRVDTKSSDRFDEMSLYVLEYTTEFSNKHQDFLNWLQTHAPYIGDDEICIALAAHKYNIFLNSFSPKWTFVSIYDYLSGDKEHTFLHGKSESPQYKQILIDFTLDSQE